MNNNIAGGCKRSARICCSRIPLWSFGAFVMLVIGIVVFCGCLYGALAYLVEEFEIPLYVHFCFPLKCTSVWLKAMCKQIARLEEMSLVVIFRKLFHAVVNLVSGSCLLTHASRLNDVERYNQFGLQTFEAKHGKLEKVFCVIRYS